MLHHLRLDRLHAHPMNANAMPSRLFDKLVEHLRRSDRCPPLIVRPLPGSPGDYQLLDGHHRAAALRRLGRDAAACLVWDVDDAEALLLLATLNRLQGSDDPRSGAELVEHLRDGMAADLAAMSRWLPEDADALRALARVRATPAPTPPQRLPGMPVTVHFFLPAEDKRELDATLARLGGTREQALMALVRDSCPPLPAASSPRPGEGGCAAAG